MPITRRTILGLAATAGMAGFAGAARAYPERSITYVIPFSPGGESDISARLQQPVFKEKFGQDLVVSYDPGDGGAAAWTALNKAKGDGYTIVGVNLPHIVLQPLEKDVGYKTEDITTVYWFQYTPDAIVVKLDSPYQTLQDLIDTAKKNPGKLTFSGSGRSSANQLAQVRFDKLAGIKTAYVPFKGTGASNTALLGAQVQASWGFTTSAISIGEQARILAVAAEERHPKYPNSPTFRELGFDLVSGAYRGIAVPKDTPQDIQKRLSDMFGKVNADPVFRKKMIDNGFAMVDVPLGKIDEFMKQRTQEYMEAAKEGGIFN